MPINSDNTGENVYEERNEACAIHVAALERLDAP